MAFGFNFRETLAFVTDGPNDKWVDSEGAAGIYPQTDTIGGESVTYGWIDNAGVGGRNRNNTIDPRIAGNVQIANSAKKIFRIDLPAIGTYDVTLGGGSAAFGADSYIVVKDSATPKLNLAGVVTSAQVFDSEGTVFAPTDWAANQVSTELSFITTTVFVEVGADGLDTGNSALAHIGFELTAPAYPPPPIHDTNVKLVAAGASTDSQSILFQRPTSTHVALPTQTDQGDAVVFETNGSDQVLGPIEGADGLGTFQVALYDQNDPGNVGDSSDWLVVDIELYDITITSQQGFIRGPVVGIEQTIIINTIKPIILEGDQ